MINREVQGKGGKRKGEERERRAGGRGGRHEERGLASVAATH